MAEDGEPHWVALNEVSNPRAVALAVHGLNTNVAAIFADLGEALVEPQVLAFGLQLSGHRIDPQTRRAVPGELSAHADFGRWTREVREAASVLARRWPQQPRLGVGYSIGGAATLAAQAEASPFQGVVGLAPAVAMTPLTRALCRLNYALMKPFGLEGWAWRPSAVRAPYRANDAIAANALYTGEQAQQTFEAMDSAGLQALRGRVTVLMRQRDGVVSARRVRAFFEQHALDVEWRTLPERPDGAWSHEVFDRSTLGESWDTVMTAIQARLQRMGLED
ncbi:MAG: alpha/beta hydrolase [Myxococcota bacterium]